MLSVLTDVLGETVSSRPDCFTHGITTMGEVACLPRQFFSYTFTKAHLMIWYCMHSQTPHYPS